MKIQKNISTSQKRSRGKNKNSKKASRKKKRHRKVKANFERDLNEMKKQRLLDKTMTPKKMRSILKKLGYNK